jgi:hypothetical protein
MALATKLKPARSYPSVNAVHGIRARINQVPNAANGEFAIKAGAGNAVHVGTIPAGSFVLPGAKHVTVAFDGTTPAIDIGTIAVPGGFGPTAQILPGAIAFAGAVQGTLNGFVADETPVYVTMSSGAGNTVGAVDIVLLYYSQKD